MTTSEKDPRAVFDVLAGTQDPYSADEGLGSLVSDDLEINASAYIDAINNGASPREAIEAGQHRSRMLQAGSQIATMRRQMRDGGQHA